MSSECEKNSNFKFRGFKNSKNGKSTLIPNLDLGELNKSGIHDFSNGGRLGLRKTTVLKSQKFDLVKPWSNGALNDLVSKKI